MPQDLTIRIIGDSTSYTRSIAAVESGIRRASGATQQFGHTSVSSVQAASAAIRTLEGGIGNNVRAIERWVTTIPGMGAALQALFPVIGGIATIGLFARMGREAYDFIQQINQIPRAAQQAAQAFNISQEATLSHLLLENDALDRQLAKLQQKPDRNGPKEALDEAFASAVQFTQQLDTTNKKLEEVFKADAVSGFQSFTSSLYGNRLGANSDIETELRNRISGIDNVDYQRTQAAREGRTGDVTSLTKQYNDLQASAIAYAKNQIALRSGPVHFGPGDQIVAGADANGVSLSAARAFGGNQQPTLTALQSFVTSLQTLSQIGDLQSAIKGKQGTVKSIGDANSAAGDAARLAAEQQKALDERVAFRDKMVKTWQSMTAADAEEVQKQIDLSQKWADSISKSDDEALKKQQDFAAALEKHQDQIADIMAKNGFSTQENRINLAAQSGQLSPYAAAQQTAQIHTQQYQSESSRLTAAIHAAMLSGNTSESYQLQDQLAELQSKRPAEQDTDQYRIASAAGSFREALDQFVSSTQSAATEMGNIVAGTLNSTNQSLAQALTAHTSNGQEYRRGIRNAFGSSLRGGATSLVSSGLHQAESGILGKFGFGGKADGSSAASALWVRMASGIGGASSSVGGAASSIGGFFKSLFGGGSTSVSPFSSVDGTADPLGLNDAAPSLGFLQGFFANGGDVVANRPTVVGDGGRPELFVPQTAGHIYPDASSVGGSSISHTINVDARGSSNPAETEAAVHRAMGQYMNYSVGAAVQAVQERQKRRPLSSR